MAVSLNPKRLFRFSIAALLFAMLCVCGYFGGYRSGYETGLQGGLEARLYAKTYPVGDLVISRNIGATQADFQSLIDLLQTTVAPESWQVNGGGGGKIQIFASSFSLIITQTNDVHNKIANLIGEFRTFQAKAAVK